MPTRLNFNSKKEGNQIIGIDSSGFHEGIARKENRRERKGIFHFSARTLRLLCGLLPPDIPSEINDAACRGAAA
jgi:hypothetical protein